MSPLTLTWILLSKQREKTSLNVKRSSENKAKSMKNSWWRDFTKTEKKKGNATLSLSLSFSIPAESPLPKSLHGAASVLRRCRKKYSSLAFRNGAQGPFSQGAYDNQVWSLMVQINSAGLCISQILDWNDINLLCHINSYRMKSMEIPRRYNISWFLYPSQPEVPHQQPGEPRPQVTKGSHTQKRDKWKVHP